jgi:uncharacterized protein DUF5996
MPTDHDGSWPALPLAEWSDTHATLHMWLQIVGKVRLVQGPPINHSWGVTFYPTARGLTTSPMPYDHRTFAIDFDFCSHELLVRTSEGREARVALEPQTVARFYRRVMDALGELGIRVRIYPKPNEVPDAIRFDEDEVHRAYDRAYVERYFRILSQSEAVLERFRARFIGKCSPVHFFWGAPDLAVTRFSGRRAPEHPGGIPNLPDRVAREAYSHEVSSVGFWAGGGPVPHAAFYAYAYPEPPGFASAPVAAAGAFYQKDLREFILPYDAVRAAPDPEAALLAFAQSTYEAAADLGKWDRAALERAG